MLIARLLTWPIRHPARAIVLAAVLAQFPFPIRGFHTDNGSEYINHRVAEMLRKLHAEFTKSRACRSQDNALVEGKNGAVIRKLMGYGHMAGQHAAALQEFYVEHLNPYLNFHRPCGFASVSLDERANANANTRSRTTERRSRNCNRCRKRSGV